MDNDEEDDSNANHLDIIYNDDEISIQQKEKTPIQKLFTYLYSIFIFILLLCILYLLYRYFTKNTSSKSPQYYNQSSSPNINIIPENDRIYISNMLDNFIKNGS